MDTNKDWREWAYLQIDNWPECIPNSGPKREYGPYPWGNPKDGCENYPPSHPDAASIGNFYTGNVCLWCGVPIHAKDDKLRTPKGEQGTLMEIEGDRDEFVHHAYHKTCWYKRSHRMNETLDYWAAEV